MRKNLQLILYSSSAQELRVYFGHLYLYAPERLLYIGISRADRLEMEKLWKSYKLKELQEVLDKVIEPGKDKAKRYLIFRRPITLGHRPAPLMKTIPDSRLISPDQYVSKTGIIRYARYIQIYQKTEINSSFGLMSRSEIFKAITDYGTGKDYGLLNYLKTTWVDDFLNGRLRKEVYNGSNFANYVSFYGSRKNGWI